MANCLASQWEGSTCNYRDYIGVVATATFCHEKDNPNEIKAELRASATHEWGKTLVFDWVEECKEEYHDILVNHGGE